MEKFFSAIAIVLVFTIIGCNSRKKTDSIGPDKAFAKFEDRFLDNYWKQYPAYAIYVGYGKHYDLLVIPDSASFAKNIVFSKQWIDSLYKSDYKQLSDNNKISFNIIKNQLESDIWYQSVFRQQEWDAAAYNISWECDYIINQPYAQLDERLKILTKHLQHVDQYYKAALNILHQPTKEHTELSILQNQGGLSVSELLLTIQSGHRI